MKSKTIMRVSVVLIMAAAISAAGIITKQSFFRIMPLYVSLVISILNANLNRTGPLLGGFNSLVYAAVYWYYGLYAMALQAVLVSCPIQLLTWYRWRKNAYRSSTVLRSFTWKQRGLLLAAFAAVWCGLYVVLTLTDSTYKLFDNSITLLGIVVSLLTLFAFREYTFLNFLNGIISVGLYIAMIQETPEQLCYLIYSVYSLVCLFIAMINGVKLWREQNDVSVKEPTV